MYGREVRPGLADTSGAASLPTLLPVCIAGAYGRRLKACALGGLQQ